MLEPTLVTWILVVIGVLIFLPVQYAHIILLLRPHDQKTKDILIGKGEDWRDKSHLRVTLGIAWADLIVLCPLMVAGGVGVLLGEAWGYALWVPAGAISVYISVILWFSEREYVYSAWGALACYTFFLGLLRLLGSGRRGLCYVAIG